MKKSYIFIVVMIILICACQRSQFSITSRRVRNGKVSYTNRYPVEERKSAHVKHIPSQVKHPETGKLMSLKVDENDIQQMTRQTKPMLTPVQPVNPGPIASLKNGTSLVPLRHGALFPLKEMIILKKTLKTLKNYNPSSDTIKKPTDTSQNHSAKSQKMIIRFKDKRLVTARIISQTADTLKYEDLSPEGGIKVVSMKDVVTLQPDHRKIEIMGVIGFVLSVLAGVGALFSGGMIIGMVLAMCGIALGIISLSRIHRFYTRLKGQGFGVLAIVLGVIGYIVDIVLLISAVSSCVSTCSTMTFHV